MIKAYARKQDCCGCTACKSICPKQAIKMQPDDEGFLYPTINGDLCMGCGMCNSVCPLQNEVNIQGHFLEPLVYALKHKSNDVRMSSSSGGAYTALSDSIMSRNTGKEYSLYGAEFYKEKEFVVRHKGTSTVAGRDSFRGSKYVQSDLEDVFNEIKQDLLDGNTVLFTGTPCQTAGLSNYIQKTTVCLNIKNAMENLILNDLICHGVQSPLLWKRYLDFIQTKFKSKLQEYTFRLKEKGWHGYNVRAVFESGRYEINTDDIKAFVKLYSSKLALRPSCYTCQFANMDRPSDISIGDFWGIEKSMPEMDDNKGVSLVLINSVKGEKIFEQMKDSICFKQSNMVDCSQHNLQQPTQKPVERERFWQDFQIKGFDYVVKTYTGCGLIGKIKSLAIKILQSLGLLSIMKKVLSRYQ